MERVPIFCRMIGSYAHTSVGAALRLLRIDCLREGQLEIVLAALEGKSLLMVTPTGSGKSLCFQLPPIRGVHRFMIDKTIEGSKVAGSEREAVRGQKLAALHDMHALARVGSVCFRRKLLAHFQTDKRTRRSLGRRLLSWVFSERVAVQKQRYCCDFCSTLSGITSPYHLARSVLGSTVS